jgi:cell wall-associated NlpC family hydrolase
MQHRYFAQACTRVVAGIFIGVLMTAATGAFADETVTSQQIASTAPAQLESDASSPSLAPSQTLQPATTSGRAKAFLSGMAGKAGDVVVGALNMIGVRYRWGGNSPDSGLDCSGFVRYVFQDTLGLALPRRAEEMSHVGAKVRMADLKPGDLVFFNTMRRTFSHVGIYIGGNKFVHSPSTGSTIRVDDLDDRYWEKRFTGARRIETAFPVNADALRKRVSATIGAEQDASGETNSAGSR